MRPSRPVPLRRSSRPGDFASAARAAVSASSLRRRSSPAKPCTSRTRSRPCSRSSEATDGRDGRASTRHRTTGRTAPRSREVASSRPPTRPAFALNRVERAEGVEPTPGRPRRAVRRHRARRRSRPRLPQHGGLPARRPRCRMYALDARTRVASAGSSRRSPSRGRRARPAGAELVPRVGRRRRSRLRRHLEPRAVGRLEAHPNGGAFRGRTPIRTRSSCSDGQDRQPGLVRPGRPPRRPRLRLPRHADPGAGRGREPVVRRGQGRSCRGVGPADAAARLVACPSGRTSTTSGRCPRRPTRVCPGLFGGRADADGARSRPAVRSGRRAVHDRERRSSRRRLSSGDAGGGHGRARGARRRNGPARLGARARLGSASRCADRLARRRVRRRRSTAGSHAFVGANRATLWRRSRARRHQRVPRPSSANMLFVAAGAPHRDVILDRRDALARRRPPTIGERGYTMEETLVRSRTTSASRAPSQTLRDCSTTSRRSSTERPSRSSSCSPRSRAGGHVLFEDVPGTAEDHAGSVDRRLDPRRDGRRESSARPTSSRPTSPGSRSSTSGHASSSSGRDRCSRTSCSSTRSTARCRRRSPRSSRRWESVRRRSTASRTAARPVPAPRDGEPDRAGGNLPAPRGTARPLLAQDRARLSDRSTRRSRSSEASASRTRVTRLQPVVDLEDVAQLEQALDLVYTDAILLRWIIELVAATADARERRAGRLGSCEPRTRADRSRLGAHRGTRLREPRGHRAAVPAGAQPSDRLHAHVPRRGPPARVVRRRCEAFRRECLERVPRPQPNAEHELRVLGEYSRS